jgi:cyclic pyranopterin phosphate synthase
MPADGIESKKHQDILSYEDIIKIVKIGKEMGIKKVRLTGGEPLVRLNLDQLVAGLTKLDLEDISMTTNGVLLTKYAEDLKKAGLKRVNISLDTLKRDKYKIITRRDKFSDAIKGIEAALNNNLSPVKINVVIMKGINDDEILDFVRLSRDRKLHVRFIEYMPLGGGEFIRGAEYLETAQVKDLIKKEFTLKKASVYGGGPANYFKVIEGKGTIGFISPMSQHFCNKCNRLRLTADAKLRPCLAEDIEIDFGNNLTKDIITAKFKEALIKKPASHKLNIKNSKNRLRTMSQIGG